jgi:hypothetical protein
MFARFTLLFFFATFVVFGSHQATAALQEKLSASDSDSKTAPAKEQLKSTAPQKDSDPASKASSRTKLFIVTAGKSADSKANTQKFQNATPKLIKEKFSELDWTAENKITFGLVLGVRDSMGLSLIDPAPPNQKKWRVIWNEMQLDGNVIQRECKPFESSEKALKLLYSYAMEDGNYPTMVKWTPDVGPEHKWNSLNDRKVAIEAITKFHKGIISDDLQTRLNALASIEPNLNDFNLLFGQEDGEKLWGVYKEFVFGMRSNTDKIKAAFERRGDLIGVSLERIEGPDSNEYFKNNPAQFPKNVQVFTSVVTTQNGGGGASNYYLIDGNRTIFIRDITFSAMVRRLVKEKTLNGKKD